ncbi:MAG: hypothetical protein N2319_08700 [Candidatus Kapabacteria bacterium]|nr:hypothetical protein [Candidatus Kapabacteria bacterium]
MKTIFFVLVLLHGLIHFIGFFKGFGLLEVKEISLPISKSVGLIWLIAGVLILIYWILFLTNSKYSWLLGIFAVVFSQILIIIFWKDAKFGTIPNLIILFVSLVSLGSFILKNEFTACVNSDFSNNNYLSTEVLTESDMNHLPDIIKKYLHYTKAVGQPKVKNFRAEFIGGIRSKPDEKFMNIYSVQYNFYQKPSRYFYIEASKMGIPSTGLHLYQNEKASFVIKVLNWFKVVDARGDKLDKAETVTLFNDMCLIAPPTLIDRRINWENINDTTVKGIFRNGNITISATLYFNEDGKLVNFISYDRYETDGKKYISYPWETPVEEYKMINNYFLPSKAKLIYQKPQGNFIYGEFEYKSVKYNLSQIED